MYCNEEFNVCHNGESEHTNQIRMRCKALPTGRMELIEKSRQTRRCNTKARKIVQYMVEPLVDVHTFLLMLKYIDKKHLETVIERRGAEKICGYPLCRQRLKRVPTSDLARTNKTPYGVTIRDNFCSGRCCKSMLHIMEQMLTSPLWRRDYEDIPPFRLLNSNRGTNIGGSSVESILPEMNKLGMAEKKVNEEERQTQTEECTRREVGEGQSKSHQEELDVDMSTL